MQEKPKSKFASKIEAMANELVELVKDNKGTSVLLLVTEAEFDGRTDIQMAMEGAPNQVVTSLVEFGMNQQSAPLFGAATEVVIMRRTFNPSQAQQQSEQPQAVEAKEAIVKPLKKDGKK